MESELCRIASYGKWPCESSSSLLSLAKNGFYYAGSGDEIECVHCKTRLIGWNGLYNPLEKHREVAPGCGARLNGDVSRNSTTDGSGRLAIGNSRGASKYSNTDADDPGVDMLDNNYSQLQKNGSTISGPLLGILKAAKERANNRQMSQINHKSGPQQLDRDFQRFKKETERFNTFHNWPASDIVEPRELAKQGFFYTGREDRVQCAFCQGYIYQWKPGDNPKEEHKKHHPSCSFVRGNDVGNTPTVLVEEAANVAHESSNEVARTQMNHDPPTRSLRSVRNSSLLVERQQTPKFPEFMLVDRRLSSFTYGTLGRGQTAERLADAGFFYVGPNDKVQCFQCGGNLKDWEHGDDPYDEHRRWYEYCPYAQAHQPSITARAPETSLPTIPVGIGSYRIEPREVKARMDTPTVRAIVDMGYSRDMIKAAIETKLSTTGDDFMSAEHLLEAIFQLQEKMATSSAAAAASGGASTSYSSGYGTQHSANSMTSLLSEGRHEPESAEMSTNNTASSSSVTASAMSPTAAPKPSEMQAAAANLPAVSELANDATAKAKGKKRRNKKKKPTAVPDAANADEDRSVDNAAGGGAEGGAEGLGGEEKSSLDDGVVVRVDDIQDEEAMKYLEENRQLREARQCKVCMDQEVNTVFLPCGHLVCCANCSPQLKNCPICRTYIRGTVKTFLS